MVTASENVLEAARQFSAEERRELAAKLLAETLRPRLTDEELQRNREIVRRTRGTLQGHDRETITRSLKTRNTVDINLLGAGTRCLVDANILIYHLADASDDCSKFCCPCWRGQLRGIHHNDYRCGSTTSTHDRRGTGERRCHIRAAAQETEKPTCLSSQDYPTTSQKSRIC